MTFPIRDVHAGAGFGVLSEREQQVAAMICDGLERVEIARTLGITTRTVDTHRHRVLHKVGAANSVQLLRAAILDGFASMHDCPVKGTP